MVIKSQDGRVLTEKIDLKIVSDSIIKVRKNISVEVKANFKIVTDDEKLLGIFKRDYDAQSVLDEICQSFHAGCSVYEVPKDSYTEYQRLQDRKRQARCRERNKLKLIKELDNDEG